MICNLVHMLHSADRSEHLSCQPVFKRQNKSLFVESRIGSSPRQLGEIESMRFTMGARDILFFHCIWGVCMLYSSSAQSPPNRSQRLPVPMAPRSMAAMERESIQKAVTASRDEAAQARSRMFIETAVKAQKPPRGEMRGRKASAEAAHEDHTQIVIQSGNLSSKMAITHILADLIPHGMLSIAFGMATGGGTGPAVASFVLIAFGTLSWYSLISLARASETVLLHSPRAKCKKNGIKRYTGHYFLSAIWQRAVPTGNSTAFIPELFCLGLTIGCLVFYSAVLGDLTLSIVSGLTGLPERRWSVLLLLHAVGIVPLCLGENTSVLDYCVPTGLVGIVFTILFVAKRLFDQTYSIGGAYYSIMPGKLHPAPQIGFPHQSRSSFGFAKDIPSMFCSNGVVSLMKICCISFACHYNGVDYFVQLKDHSLNKFKGVAAVGIGVSALTFWCMMIFGYATFGRHAQALVLNNYHGSEDILATVARLFMAVAIISGYKLTFSGLQASLFSCTKLDRPKVEDRHFRQKSISAVVIAGIAVGACFVTEYELGRFVQGVAAFFGAAVVYVLPAIINISLLRARDVDGEPLTRPFFKGETLFSLLLMLFGLAVAASGTGRALH